LKIFKDPRANYSPWYEVSLSMHSISIVVTASLAMFLPAKAANLAVEPRFLGGPCHPYGGYVQSMSTGNGMVQSLNIAITDTGTLLDNLTIKVGTIDVPQRGAYPYSYVRFAFPSLLGYC